ncbi:MAG: YihY/virulence factor BrkB family protein [Candidatus Velthaea sp.]
MGAHIDFGMIKETFSEWSNDKAPRLAAALSYSTIFSIAPLLIIVIAIAGTILGFREEHGHTDVENQLVGQISSRVGPQAGDMVRSMITANFSKASSGIFAQIVGYIMFIVGASGVFAALQDSLNTVWHVELPKRGIWVTVRERVASLGMVLVIGFLLLVSFIASAALAIVSAYLTHLLPFPGAGLLFQAVNYLVSLGVVTLLFALIYKYLPDAKIDWSDVWVGSAMTALLFVVGQALIGIYIARSGVASAYGAAGALLAILIWIYYSSMILLMGAEFTKVYARRRGKSLGSMAQAAGAIVQPAQTAAR